MVENSIKRFAALSKLTKQEKQFRTDLAETFLEYLDTLSFEKRIIEIESILFETEIKRIISLDKRLTTQEWQCFIWAYKGKGVKMTAQIMGVNKRTVENHRSNIFKKLRANNMSQAIALGIKYRFFPSADQLLPDPELKQF
ncbi:MAG: Bacterial regulatory protein luxR family [Pseudomonadota bacterium]|jgi:DNA-binding CsgD family transcriptional regulator